MKMPSAGVMQHMAETIAHNICFIADEAAEYDMTEEEKQSLYEISDRLLDGTATDEDWLEAVAQLDFAI